MAITAFRPLTAMTLPPGCVAALQRYTPSIGVHGPNLFVHNCSGRQSPWKICPPVDPIFAPRCQAARGLRDERCRKRCQGRIARCDGLPGRRSPRASRSAPLAQAHQARTGRRCSSRGGPVVRPTGRMPCGNRDAPVWSGLAEKALLVSALGFVQSGGDRHHRSVRFCVWRRGGESRQPVKSAVDFENRACRSPSGDTARTNLRAHPLRSGKEFTWVHVR